MTDVGDKRRVFFALWPDADTAARIDAAAAALVRDGRRIRVDKLHMTLAFVGAVDAPVVERLVAQAGDIAAAPFRLRLDHGGYFRRPRILWLGPSKIPDQLALLAVAVAAVAGQTADSQHFRPHVSLARRASPPDSRCRLEPVVWDVDSFCLVESGSNGAPGDYRVLRRWQLQ